MNRTITACAVSLGLLFAGGVQANEKLAQSSGCMTCHQIDKKVLGPSYKDVAAKYRGNKAAEAMLVKKVKDGGKGAWGEMIMPPNSHVKDADIAALVKWILSLK